LGSQLAFAQGYRRQSRIADTPRESGRGGSRNAKIFPRCVNPFVARGKRSVIVSNYQFQGAATLILAVAAVGLSSPAQAAEKLETAVLAGGCFWGVEGVYEHVKGVRNVVSGYAGGTRGGRGGGGRSGYAEAVRISYNPAEISYNQLLEIFVGIAHDPTQVDRQGPDIGPRYRSAIFPQNAPQKQAAEQFLAKLRASGRFNRPIATRIETGRFDLAEREHQDYVRRNPGARYVVVNDLPKLAKLKRTQYWRE
jgi:peptide-methionine (S)-S-oxide reductase